MALIVTPGKLASRAEFYFQMNAMVRAGLPVISALENLEQKPPGPGFLNPIRQILQEIRNGNTFSGALATTGDWLPPFDRALLDAGERSGRIDETFKSLADYYQSTARLIRQVIGKLLYPVGLLHFALLIFPMDSLKALILENGGFNTFLMQKAGVFVPVYAGLFIGIMLMQSTRFEFWRATIERFFNLIPVIGGARRSLALARLASALEALINAGVGMPEAWAMSGSATGSPALKRITAGWRPQIESGNSTPSELLERSSYFPNVFASIYKTGEVSGQIDDALLRLRTYYQDESQRKLDLFTKALVTIVVLGVMGTIGYFIISFYSEHFKNINEAIDGF
ncbi:MAG: type II secretion system F family protein [Verrucomicrobiia bacterium]